MKNKTTKSKLSKLISFQFLILKVYKKCVQKRENKILTYTTYILTAFLMKLRAFGLMTIQILSLFQATGISPRINNNKTN